MKRLFLILLMCLLPLQTAWAGRAGIFELGESGSAPSSKTTVSRLSYAGSSAPSDSKRRTMGCCAGCHIFCNFAAVVSIDSLGPALFTGSSALVFPAEIFAYHSHIPDGPFRPQWRFAS